MDDEQAPTEAFWEARYTGREQTWSGHVNPWLAEIAQGLTPGRALDLGCGEGADAVWLARAGWDVVATDVAPTALERTARGAAAAGVGDRVRTEQHDLEVSRPGGAFDLVSAQFLQSPLAFARDEVLRAVAGTVVPGGRLLVVDHGAPPPWSTHRHAEFRSPAETWRALSLADAGWEAELVEARTREAVGPGGHAGHLVDNVVLARRTPDA